MLGGRTLGGTQTKKKKNPMFQSGYQRGGGGSQVGSGYSVQGGAGVQQKGGAPTGGMQMPGQRPGQNQVWALPGSNTNQTATRPVPPTTANAQQTLPMTPVGGPRNGVNANVNTNVTEPPPGSLDPSAPVSANTGLLPGAGDRGATSDPTQDLVEQWIRDQLSGGSRDTSGEEALIERLMQGAVGQGLVDSRARAGRFGMAASGAQAGIEGDVRRQMADAALDRIFGVQQGARDEAFRNASQGAQTWLGFQRNEADAAQQQFMNEILAKLGMGDEPSPLEDDDPTNDAEAIEKERQEKEERYRDVQPGEFGGFTGPFDKAVDRYDDASGTTWVIMQRPDGTLYKVKPGGMF